MLLLGKEENMVTIANDNWLVDLANKECKDVQFGFKIKIEYFNDCMSAKITEIPQSFIKIKYAKKRKELIKQLKIVQGLDAYIEAYRSSLVERRRKTPV